MLCIITTKAQNDKRTLSCDSEDIAVNGIYIENN